MVSAVAWNGLRGHTWGELGTWADLLSSGEVPPDPPAEPDFGPPLWYIADLLTGKTLYTLSEVKCKASDVIGQYTSTTATIPIVTDTTSPVYLTRRQVEDLTDPRWRRMLVRVAAGVPMWGGIITGRKGGTEVNLSLQVTTIPVYLDMRVTQDHDFAQADESTIVRALIGDANVEGINIIVDAPPTGVKRDRTYRRKDGASVFKRLGELSDVEGGSEWHVFLRWRPDRSGFAIVLELRPEIGVGSGDVATFTARPTYGTTTGTEATYTLSEDCSRENFANYVVAVGDGQGDAQPESAPARSAALDAGEEPRIERRFNPSSGIVEIETLNEHARADLARDERGSELWEIVARADVTPIYGLDWRIGQYIRAELTGHRHPPTGPEAAPKPGVVLEGVRAMGWDLSEDGTKLTPKW